MYEFFTLIALFYSSGAMFDIGVWFSGFGPVPKFW